jgi:hypothetical protein
MMYLIHNVVSNQYITPSTHRLHAGLNVITLLHQASLHTHTHTHTHNSFNSKDINNYPLWTYIYITYIILTEIIIVTVMECW